MSLQNRFSKSLNPRELIKLKETSDYNEFMDYFKRDCKYFTDSCQFYNELVKRYSEIKKELISKNIFDDFLKRIDFHSKLVTYKLNPIQSYLDSLYKEWSVKINNLLDSCKEVIGGNISFPIRLEDFNSLEQEKQKIIENTNQKIFTTSIEFIAVLGGFINSIFFAFESECKIVCSLACFAFSIEYARNNILEHAQVWQTLKRLSLAKSNLDDSIRCEICQMKENCKFSINFEALANVYSYAIKIRMIADYDDSLFKNIELLDKIKDYFNELDGVITIQEVLKIKCMEV